MPTENENQGAQVSGVHPPTACSPFLPESAPPKSDMDALMECRGVLLRIMRDGLLCGAGECHWTPDGSELPLYGCAVRALKHAELRMENPEGLRTRHLVEGTQHPLVGRPDDLTKNGQ